jgi:hypothetical protein
MEAEMSQQKARPGLGLATVRKRRVSVDFPKNHVGIFLPAGRENKGLFSTTRLNARIGQRLPL